MLTETALDVKKLSLLKYCNWDSELSRQHDTHNRGACIQLNAVSKTNYCAFNRHVITEDSLSLVNT